MIRRFLADRALDIALGLAVAILATALIMLLAYLTSPPARAAACTPDTTTLTSTPMLAWDAVPDAPGATVAGYHLYSRFPGGTFTLTATLPCIDVTEDPTPGHVHIGHYCPGSAPLYAATQRYRDDQLVDVEWCVTAYTIEGAESAACSNVIDVCAPALCVAPGPCS